MSPGIQSSQNAIKPNAQSEGLRFTELFQIIKLRRRVIYFFVALVVAGTTFRQIFYVPTYTAVTSLSIQKAENSPMQMALVNMGATVPYDNPDRIKKYTDYLQSNEFFVAFAETLKFQEGYHRLKLTLPSDLGLLKKKFWIQFMETHFDRKPSESNANKEEPVLVPVERLARILQQMASGESVGTDTVKIRVTTLDPDTSMILANTAAQVFVTKATERDYNEVTEVKKFITEQLEATTEKLKRSESILVDFKRRHNIISLDAEHAAFSSKVGTIDTELETTRLKFQENQRLIDYYEKLLTKLEKKLLTQGAKSIQRSNSEVVNRLRMQLDSLKQKKILMQASGFSDGSWQMSEINNQIDKIATDLKDTLKSMTPGEEDEDPISTEAARAKLAALKVDNKNLEAKMSSVERSRNDLLKSLESLPKDEQVLLTMKRDVDLQFELYSSLKKKLQEVEIQQVALQSRVLITDRAETPPPAARTHFLIKTLFALLVGIFLGSTIAFVMEAIDPTIKHANDLERLELITLGSIPHVEGSSIRKSLGMNTYRPDLLVCKEKPESPSSLSFKHIRAQIAGQKSSDGSPSKVISITSPEKGDGKSFVAANLAVSLAQLEKKTLLMDCDMRHSSVPSFFGYEENHGLTSVLTLHSALDEALLKQRLPFLDILPAGWSSPNPTELISNDKFRVLLEHLKSMYDYIIVDAPEAIAYADASVIASLSDTVVLSACFRKTKKDDMIHAIRRVLQVSNKHLYAVLNNVWEVQEKEEFILPETINDMSQLKLVDSKAELESFEKALKQKKAS